ncbi:M48 family metalloprotease [Amphiplicatus metriothermophilus]|uniref:Putative Zn-dependent protease, contains TPR repeats n=1 Tax=Amphiplicatus metriothermophilus TaxID=1519374 RepID=A0A239Q079_9PROT|nr:M48 family metalloprotease [Amphiplicatus metriothermophilus]MBB5520164.1 putative Zn-dependent protease [Amphiplicatus metriothermophilus]SNT75924.1 Putative Zn-dependent protease, contains TPR repeats [Amphiplicatus metriothermophilus]
MFQAVRKILAAFAALGLVLGQAQAQTLLRDAEIENWIKDHAFPIFRAAGLPAESINIYLIGDPTPNAFAGGLNMGIHTGLFTTADTPNQIEGVIAHEAAHIAGGHTARSDEALAAASRPMLLSLVLAAGAIAAGAPEAGIGILGLGQNIGIKTALRYSRGQEAASDQAAITYLDRIGRSSKGLIDFFSKLRNYQVLTSRRINPYLQSHPLANERMTALIERAEASPYYHVEDSPEEIERLKMIQAKINGFLQETNVTLRQYPLSDQSDPARYARAVAYYRGSEIDKALKEIDHLIEKRPDNPYFHELKGQMLFEFGRVTESIAPHARSVELAPAEPLLRINLARALIATEDPARYPEAIDELKAALALERDNAFAWFELARAYGGLGQESLAYLATAESRYHLGAKAEANQFARRARAGLEKGTPEWRQATDIILATQDEDGARGLDAETDDAPHPERTPPRPQGEVPDPQG